MMDARRSAVEAQARAAERSVAHRTSSSAVLEATIRSAELYMQALRLADTPADRQRLDAKCKELLTNAEQLKSAQDATPQRPRGSGELKAPTSTRKLSTRENIILLEGSKLNGFVFKPWVRAPSPDEFSLEDGGSPFSDSVPLSLSPSQLECFAGWKKPREALGSLEYLAHRPPSSREPIMYFPPRMDLVQDMTSDCSVVASLCAETSRVERGHAKILPSIIYPYDQPNDQVTFSPNGKYVLRFYFNGCWRRVEIDDFLPTSKTSRVLHVVDRNNPALLWPALLEKAYLKVRGGYDFPGSNSGTDLAVLTGWIPQQVFLHDEEVEPERLWDEISTAFRHGDILLTIGTGKLSRREQKCLGLAAEHDYAILEMNADDHGKEMLVKNPWADGDVWRGATRRRPNRAGDGTADPENLRDSEGMIPGTFWMDFNSVFQYFENMYINWNPGLFSHRQDLHFSWQVPNPPPLSNIFIDHPQFAVRSSEADEIWLLLNRHFRTGDYTQANHGKNGYISLYLFPRGGNKVLSSDGAQVRGPFVDSPNTLVRLEAPARTTYTAVVASQDLPRGKLNFTLSAFSRSPVTVTEAQVQVTRKDSVHAAWTRTTAGGNSDSPRYLSNPQFKLSLPSRQKIALLLRLEKPDSSAPMPDMHVKILVVFSDGSRVTRLRSRDAVAHSGDYRRGSAVVETELDKGHYTTICSTFDENQYAPFSLDFYSSSSDACSLVPLAAEGSGRLNMMSSPARFANRVSRLLAPLTVGRVTRVIFIARHDLPVPQPSLFKMTLEQGQGPYKRVIASSEFDDQEFNSIAGGLRIADVDLQPSMHAPGTGGLWLVLERLLQGSDPANPDETVYVEVLTEEKIAMGVWGLGEG